MSIIHHTKKPIITHKSIRTAEEFQ
jgi:hypothetical protein